ncbi:alpha-keto acid decarboxylase family protein [Edwardsiella ictaluri]|uniref:alpha-keto acid decarboxylase family protein n=1 Tax=Edwardsiella ictaluri TaxID=67780 RepID=UPI0009C10040|nr:thiamine pyrophosphate-binding protein [Edwardsiella ictaluri]ARD40104.1 indole-3-pyruvate decarboxylase [Edwardsiella ictaluri]QPW25644.1 alpha-keto acid decarboxylase family protein [Edwardsiella ictaluri]
MTKTVIQHVLSRLYALGISDIFGVPGDYAFPIGDAVCADTRLRWIGNCNELNAAYAADGYARLRGMSALITTFGVGELSALCGIAGANAESLPLFHLVGMPASGVQAEGKQVHHTLGDGDFTHFYQASTSLVCARAILTPDNCISETERLITAALRYRKPAYIGIPSDYAVMPVILPPPLSSTQIHSDPQTLSEVSDIIAERLNNSRQACALPGIYLQRHDARREALALIEASGLCFATMIMDKSVLDESHPNYIGMYNGHLLNPNVREFVESCDCVLKMGTLMSDFNTGAFTARLNHQHCITVLPESVLIGTSEYHHVLMKDVLEAVTQKVRRKARPDLAPKPQPLAPVSASGAITAPYLYARWQQMLKPHDILVAETGTCSMGLSFVLMPEGATFHNQTLWGAIGWATPAALGAAAAAATQRTILISGEGSHQLTVQEISQFARLELKPLIFILNNNGYLIERLLCKDGDISYNDLAQWQYHQLPEAMGCKGWFSARVATCEALDAAIRQAEKCDCGAYIEGITGKYDASPLAEKMHQSMGSLYQAD